MSNSRSSLLPPPWFLYAVAAATCWGIWGPFSTFTISAWATQVLFTAALLPSVLVVALSPQVVVGTNRIKGLTWGFVGGLLAALGNISFYLALSNGALSAIAIPLTNIYPLVTIFIAFFLFKERLNWIQMIGILIALGAIWLLSIPAEGDAAGAARPRFLGIEVWVLYSLGAMLMWGVFSATQKLSTNHVSAEMSYIAWVAAFIPLAILIVVWKWGTPDLDWAKMSQKMLWANLTAGALNGFGVVFAFAAYRYEGKAALVTPLAAAVQPLVTVVLAMAIGEKVALINFAGIALAIVAAVALSMESKKEPVPAPAEA